MLRGLLAVAVVALAGCAPARERGLPVIRLEVGDNLGAMVAGGGDVWVNDFGRDELVRLDERSGRVVSRMRLGRRLTLAARGGDVWALRWGGRFFRTPNGPLFRIDAATNRVIWRLRLRAGQIGFGLVAGEGGLWVWGPDRVVQLEVLPSFGPVEIPVAGPYGELTGAAAYADGLLATTGDGHLARIDRRGILRGRREPALAGTELQAVAGERALASRGGTLIAADARTARPLWRRPLGFRISTVLEHDGLVLVHGAAFDDPGDRLWALDPATGRVLATTTIPSFGTTSMVLAGGSLWVSTAAGDVIVFPPLLLRLFLAGARAG